MSKISKSYLKSFIKDIFVLSLMILYLIIMFVVIFILSNTSLQMNKQYSEIKSKSNKWDSSFSTNGAAYWHITYIGINIPNDTTNFFNILEKITDEDGHKLLTKDWYKEIYTIQLGGNWDQNSDYINLSDNSNDPRLSNLVFDNIFSSDIQVMSLISSEPDWINFKVPDANNSLDNGVNLSKIFNPDAKWNNINYSFNKALYEEINDNTNNYNKIETSDKLGFNANITLANYISKATLSKDNNNTQIIQYENDVNNILQLKQQLNITFIDNIYRKNMSQVFLQNNKGNMPKKDNEILVNKQFADNNHFKIGDKIKLFGNNTPFNQITSSGKELVEAIFTIVGYGMSLSTSTTQEINHNDNNKTIDNKISGAQKGDIGNIYTTYSEYNKIQNILINENKDEIINDASSTKKSLFNYEWNSTGSILNPILFFNNYSGNGFLTSDNPDKYNDFSEYVYSNKYLDLDALNHISESWDNSKVHDDLVSNKTNIIVNVVMLFFILGFSFIFLNLIIKRDIDNSKRQLGIFKMLGYKTSELSLIYSYKVLFTFFISSILGYLISIPIQIYSSSYMFKYSIVILTITKFNHMPSLLLFAFIFIPILFTGISFLINLKYIKLPPLKLISDNIRIKNVRILKLSKKIEIRKKPDLRLKKAFTIQNLWKWVSITSILSFSLLTLITNASSSVSFNNYLKNSVGSVLNKNTKTNIVVNSMDDENIEISKNLFQTNSYYNGNNPYEIKDANNIIVQDKINSSLKIWHDIVTKNIDNWITINIKENPYVHIDDLQKIINKFYINNYDNYALNTGFLLALINLEYVYYNSSSDTIVCLNNITQKKSSNFNSMVNWISSLDIAKKITTPLTIYGLDNRNNYDKFTNFFNSKNQMTEKEYDSIMEYNDDQRTIPIIISKKLSDTMNWKNGNLIKSTEKNNINLTSHQNSENFISVENKDFIDNINLKIVGITKDIYTTDIYTSYKNLAKFYIDSKGINYANGNPETNYGLLNNWLDNNNMYPNFKNLNEIAESWNNFKSYLLDLKIPPKTNDLNLDYYYTAQNYNLEQNEGSYLAGDYFNNWSMYGNNDYLNLTNAINFSQLNNTISSFGEIAKIASDIQIIFILLLVSILIIILISIIIDENKKAIMILKVIGYKNKNINRITTSNIIIIMISSFIIGIILSKILLSFISNYVRIKFNFYIDLPLSASKIIEIGILVTILFLTVWRVTLNQIKKHKIEELEKLD